MRMQTLSTLLSGVAMTPTERAQGRYLRAPEGHESTGNGADSGQGGTNPDGNSGESTSDSGNQNNAGDTFKAETFWNQPPSSNSSPNGESAEEGGGGQPSSEEIGKGFAQTLQNLQFGEVFTNDALKALNENQDPAAFHQNLQTFGRETVRQSILMAARLMQVHGNQLREELRNEFIAEFGNREADADLIKAIPSASNPAVKPMVDSIFRQAMKVTGGKRAQAIEMTKEMLKFQSTTLQDDLGLRTPPPSAADQLASPTDWEKELLGR